MSEQPVDKMFESSMAADEEEIGNKDKFPYNFNFSEDNWQHYYDYGIEDGKAIGVCRKFLKAPIYLSLVFRKM